MSPIKEKTALRKLATELTEPSPTNEMRTMRARPLFEADVGEKVGRQEGLPDDPEEEEEEEPPAHHERPTSPSLSDFTRSPSPSNPPQAAAPDDLNSGQQPRASETEHQEEQDRGERSSHGLYSPANEEAPGPVAGDSNQPQRQGERSQSPHEEHDDYHPEQPTHTG